MQSSVYYHPLMELCFALTIVFAFSFSSFIVENSLAGSWTTETDHLLGCVLDTIEKLNRFLTELSGQRKQRHLQRVNNCTGRSSRFQSEVKVLKHHRLLVGC